MEDEECSIDEFLMAINDDELWGAAQNLNGCVFWMKDTGKQPDENQQYSSPDAVRLAVKRMIEALPNLITSSYLIQFWSSKRICRKTWLTTSEETFYTGWPLSRGMLRYRNYCMNSVAIEVGQGAKEDNLGPIGRAFRNKHLESSPDLRFYSSTDHPLRDEALACGVKAYIASPVFSLNSTNLLGVLEFSSIYGGSLQELDEQLRSLLDHEVQIQIASMRCAHINAGPKEPHLEFKEMLIKAINAIPQLQLAQVWVPCHQCEHMGNKLRYMERAAFIAVDDREVNSTMRCTKAMTTYINISEFENVSSQKGILEIAGASTNKSCFCRNICDMSICDYPLAHYARWAGLSFWFAIYLQSGQNEAQFCILEFFLQGPESNDGATTLSLLDLIFSIIEDNLTSFKVAPRQRFPEELVVTLGKKFEFAFCEDVEPDAETVQSVAEAAKELDASNSKFVSIKKSRWRSNPCTSSASKRSRSSPVITECTDNFVVIKATFGGDIVRFRFYQPWNMKKLREKVGRRFELQIGSFEMHYEDHEGLMMLLGEHHLADNDLRLCIDMLTSLGKTPIHISVESIPPNSTYCPH